jgi:hypothetical protein
MSTILYIAALFALACFVGGFRKSREWDDAEEQYLRTQRKLATIREQQRSPRVVERNLERRLRDEMRRGRMNQVAQVYAEIERNGA